MSEHRPSCPRTPHLTSTVLVIQEAEELSKSEEAGEALTCIQRLDRLQRPYSAGRDSMHTWRTSSPLQAWRFPGFSGVPAEQDRLCEYYRKDS